MSASLGTAFAALVGGLIGASTKELVSWLFGRLKANSEDITAQRDLILETIVETRDIALEYWSSTPADHVKSCLLEGRILGRLHFISKMCSSIYSQQEDKKREIDAKCHALRKIVTDGQFGVVGRIAEPKRATDIEIHAYELIAKIRSGRKLFRFI